MRNKEMLKKMSVKCVTAIMIAAMSMSPVAATLAFPMTVYAETVSDNPQDTRVEVVNQGDKMSNNEGGIVENDGRVENNIGEIQDNEGQVDHNFGIIDDNGENGLVIVNELGARIDSNHGTVNGNQGEIGIGEYNSGDGSYMIITENGKGNHGTVGYNNGTSDKDAFIYYNSEDGTVNENGQYGTVIFNDGTIIKNNNGGLINKNNNLVEVNDGTILESTGGTVISNRGEIVYNGIKYEGGEVRTNSGVIVHNAQDNIVGTNTASGTIKDNYGSVTMNQGTIENNAGTGIVGSVDANGNVFGNRGVIKTNNDSGIYKGVVLNLAGGVVEDNRGIVYNYGGTVNNNQKGAIEYFSVKVSNSNSTSNSSGLIQAYNQDWLGQKGITISTATITITPESGYKITNVSGFGDNVTATQNSDGTWTLTISSGANTDINVSSELLVDPSKIKIEVEPDNGNQDNPSGQNQDASNPAVTTPAIDTSATALATATWDGATIKIGETTVTVSALAAQDCAGLASTAVTQAELTVVYESIFASTIAANGRSVADARAEALRIATSLAEYITKDLPTNYTPAEAATYKAAYMDAFLKTIASGKTLKKARNAALSAARTKMAQPLLDQLNNAHTEGVTVGIETPVTPATTQAPVVGEAADPVAAQMIAQAQQAMQDAASLANGQ